MIEKRDEKLKNFDFSKANSFADWEKQMEPEQSQIDALHRKLVKLLEPEYEDIPSYGDHVTFENFVDCCKSGGFIDYDGSGNYTTKDKMTDMPVHASDITSGDYRKYFSHVVWFNK